jgi:2-iminoacetate synthase ThiH
MATYYSPLKFLHFKDHLQGLEQGKIVAPVHIRVKPTNHCNHNCWYCAYRADNLEVCTQLKDCGVNHVKVSGLGPHLSAVPLQL